MYMTMKQVPGNKAHLLRSLSWKASEKLIFFFSSTRTVVFSNIQVAALYPGLILSTPKFSK